MLRILSVRSYGLALKPRFLTVLKPFSQTTSLSLREEISFSLKLFKQKRQSENKEKNEKVRFGFRTDLPHVDPFTKLKSSLGTSIIFASLLIVSADGVDDQSVSDKLNEFLYLVASWKITKNQPKYQRLALDLLVDLANQLDPTDPNVQVMSLFLLEFLKSKDQETASNVIFDLRERIKTSRGLLFLCLALWRWDSGPARAQLSDLERTIEQTGESSQDVKDLRKRKPDWQNYRDIQVSSPLDLYLLWAFYCVSDGSPQILQKMAQSVGPLIDAEEKDPSALALIGQTATLYVDYLAKFDFRAYMVIKRMIISGAVRGRTLDILSIIANGCEEGESRVLQTPELGVVQEFRVVKRRTEK